jgi:hypothetical protein
MRLVGTKVYIYTSILGCFTRFDRRICFGPVAEMKRECRNEDVGRKPQRKTKALTIPFTPYSVQKSLRLNVWLIPCRLMAGAQHAPPTQRLLLSPSYSAPSTQRLLLSASVFESLPWCSPLPFGAFQSDYSYTHVSVSSSRMIA